MRRFLTYFIVVAAFLSLSSLSPCQESVVPSLISYQGKLVKADGSSYPDGDHQVTFRLYDAVTGGTLIWGATYTVPVVNGIFSVALGAPGGQPLDPLPPVTDLRFAFGDSDRFLEILMDGTPLLPRQQMGSVPYAIKAERAERATKAEENGVPSGTVMAFAGMYSTVPQGWEICDGREVSRTEPRYAALFAAIGTNHGTGNGTTTFRIPDYRGRFLRGADDPDGDGPLPPAGRDADATGRQGMAEGANTGNYVGSVQEDEIKLHSHSFSWGQWPAGTGVNNIFGGTILDTNIYTNHVKLQNVVGWTGGSESRPKNAYVNYIIKL